MRAVLSVALLLAMPASVSAQEARDEAQARTLREDGRQRVRDGRLEEAFDLLRAAAQRTADPTIWLEVAEVADRLRLDLVALQAYEAYLHERADAPDRVEIEGRVRVLREIVAGGRFVLEEDGAPRVARERTSARDVLVDWYGRPLVLRRSSGLVTLADWDGSIRRREPAGPRVPDLVPFPTAERDLGRRLADP